MQGFGIFLIVIALIGIPIVIYIWLFVHEKGESDPLKMMPAQQDKMDTNSGVIENRLKRRKIEEQTKTQEAITENKRAVAATIRQETDAHHAYLDQLDEPDRHKEGRELEIIKHASDMSQFQSQLTINDANRQLIKKAASQDLTLGNHQTHLLGEKLSETKVKEHRLMEEINLNSKLEEIRERVRLAIIAKFLSNEQIVTEIQTQIDNVYEQIHEIKTKNKLSEELQQRMIDDREEIIIAFKAKRNERQAGLLEVNNRGEIRGDDLDAEL